MSDQVTMEALNPKRGEVRPNEASQRPAKLFKVYCSHTGVRRLVHCHGVEYQGGFAIFWVVEAGLKREIWATNKKIEVADLPEAKVPKEYWPIDLGFYRMPKDIDADVFQLEDEYYMEERRERTKRGLES